VWSPGKPVRLIGVGAAQLSTGSGQLPLFPDRSRAESLRLERTIDKIRERFGEGAVERASRMKKIKPE
jgi:hypothetical protein